MPAKKADYLHMRITPEEKTAWGQRAREAGMTLSEWVRALVNDEFNTEKKR